MNLPLKFNPSYCVWELTLSCNARCIHCGSSAGAKRSKELTTDQALSLISQLADARTQSITFSGGEPLLRHDWLTLAKAVVAHNIQLEMITNGLLVEQLADDIAEAGFFGVTFSVDGTAQTHNRLRGVDNGLQTLLCGATALKDRGVQIGAVTQINQFNKNEMSQIHQILLDHGFDGWQVQLTIPQGNAARNSSELCLAPEELPLVEKQILEVKKHSPMFIQAADNFGYMGRHEPLLRRGTSLHKNVFSGCQAGLQVVGITSNGAVRGCLSQTEHFNEGNIGEESFQAIWNREGAFPYNRQFRPEQLTGACATCPFNKICRAGCKSLAYATTGKVSENIFCLRNLEEKWQH